MPHTDPPAVGYAVKVVSDEYQEEEHPRDMHGKWTRGDQTESPGFKSRFGESKIVDEHGKPLVVYHGTRHEFSRFDIDKGQVGAYFSVSPEVTHLPVRRVVRASLMTHFDSFPTAICCRAVAFACTGAMYLSIVKEDG